MKITRFNTAELFLEENMRFLEKEEAVNSLMLGLSLANKGKEDDKTLYLNIADDNEVLFSAIKIEGRDLIVYGKETDQKNYITRFISYLKKEKIDIPGINGPKDLVEQMGELISKEFKWKNEIGFRHMVYKLTEVKYNPKTNGKLKRADINDIEKITEWMNLFYIEAFNEQNKKSAYETTKNKIASGETYIWMDQLEVTMSCIARPTKNGISVNYVYTPQRYRNKGYATKIVAQLSELMLGKGYEFCTLFTDLDNPTSNNIYKKIGYEPIKEFRNVKFMKKTAPNN